MLNDIDSMMPQEALLALRLLKNSLYKLMPVDQSEFGRSLC